VLSTLHTNTAVGAVARLTDMGVERFLLAPMLAGVVAQRLVRRLCPDCARPDVANRADCDLLDGMIEAGTPLRRAVGCPACRGLGYRGRTGIYEVVTVDAEMEALIHGGAAEAELAALARRRGPSLVEDGVRNISAGVTTVEDVARVAQEH
jgi:general secretion pathway protein E